MKIEKIGGILSSIKAIMHHLLEIIESLDHADHNQKQQIVQHISDINSSLQNSATKVNELPTEKPTNSTDSNLP